MALPFPFTIPLTEVLIEIAGVVVAFVTDPEKPLAAATETLVTVPPVVAAFNVFPLKESPVPSVISETAVPTAPDPSNLFEVIACILL
jgi:hypothetical protein